MAAAPESPAPAQPAPVGGDRERERAAAALARARRRLFLVETALSLALPWLAWRAGVGAWLAAVLGPPRTPGGAPAPALLWVATPRGWLDLALFVAALWLAYRLALLPLAYFGGYRLSRRYGLTTQTPLGWARDWLKMTLLSLGLGVLTALAFYGSVAALGAHWWWAYALFLSAGVLLLTYVAPYVLVPLFYRLRPLEPGPLAERIAGVFARAGVRQPQVATIELSARTTAANAAVLGFGSSRRVVLGDTLLQTFGHDEIETIVAHELGHHVRGDIWRGLALEVGAIWFGLGAAAIALDPLFAALGWGDWRAPANLPQLVLVGELAGLAVLPLVNAYSRHIERAADRYALAVSQDPRGFASAMRKLANQNLIELEPPRWAKWLLYTHPPVGERIRMAEAYGRA